jgi:aspartate aminotransferase
MKKDNGEALHNTKEITKYILEEAKVAIVPFYAFGDSDNSPWYRLSVGTCRLDEVEGIINSMEAALEKLNN